MFTIKSKAAAITAGMVAFLGLEAYGFYSIRRSVETRMTQIENGIESIRAAKDAPRPEIAAQETKQETKKEPGNSKAKGARTATWREHIASDRRLAPKLQKILPAGTNLKEASSGFKTEKEFISAVYISKNLGIPFARLKERVIGNHPVTMEAAILDLRPDLSKVKARAEAERGERQAKQTAKVA